MADHIDEVLRRVAAALSAQIAPELSSALARDAANFGAGLLRGALLENLAQSRKTDYEKSLQTIVKPMLDGNAASRDSIGAWVEKLYLQSGSPDNIKEKSAAEVLAAIVAEEGKLQAGIRADDAAENQLAASDEEIVTPASLAAYLRRKLDRTDIDVINILLIPGGGSKITRIVSLRPVAGLPAEMIMRQDYAYNHVGNSIISEYPILIAMHKAKLPVAPPLFLEHEATAMGAPFMMVLKVPGRNIGNLWGFFADTEPRPVCLELAKVLATIHQTTAANVDASIPLRQRVVDQISDIHGKWSKGRSSISPVIALSLLWLVENLDTEDAVPALVHGDCAFTNILVHEGKLSALLDWEFAHIGDPAEDLAYVKNVVEQVMPWREFIDAYCAAGGHAPSARRLHYFDVWRALRNVIYAGLAGEAFCNGQARSLMLGWAGIYAVPLLEQQLIGMIGDSWKPKTAKH